MRPGEQSQSSSEMRSDYTVMYTPSPVAHDARPPGRPDLVMPPARLGTPLLHRLWWLVPLLALVLASGAWVLVDDRPPAYEARARLLVGDTVGDFDHIRAAEALTATYAELASTRTILDEAAQGLSGSVDDLVDEVAAVPVGSSRVLLVTVTATTPAAARHMANGVGDALVRFRSPPHRQIALIDPAESAEQVPDRAVTLVVLAATAGALSAAGGLLALDTWVQRRRGGRRLG